GEAHAEVHALDMAGERARGATLYVTLEPCCHSGRTLPCTDRVVQSGVSRVVAAMTDPNPDVNQRGLKQLRDAGIEVTTGVAEAEARDLNRGFIRRMQVGMPWVTIKLASSLDGRTATASGESKWITGEAARADVHRRRARSGAIMTGIGTVLADDPTLTARAPETVQQPLRVVVDNKARLPLTARLIEQPGATLLVMAQLAPQRVAALRAQGVETLLLAGDDGSVSLRDLLAALAARGVNEVLVEAGPRLCGALLRERLMDELIVYFAPHLLGDGARGWFSLPGLDRIGERIPLQIVEVINVGKDLRLSARMDDS
ncbi:MAG: bifunctional diaminohydroxyphosphoribosylaminopyrimidine deaminase/5-amino-6-(5-phosphoribosylamino)uracil reductase RibD, partial [Gammaproteobacteria bacterium]|nr:bifunctional diaminohydroxyphosphoribosylaminopyrimidine deaminase/5-amino-6-(5-phosphoribosylamino)uracil reductase RibD [Gammaproteobacteria bacterium]